MQLSSNSHCSHWEVTLAGCLRCCCYSNRSGNMAGAVSSRMRWKQTQMNAVWGVQPVDEACL